MKRSKHSMGETCITDYPTKSTYMNKYDMLNYKCLILNKLFETIILDRNPKTKIHQMMECLDLQSFH